MDKLELNNVIWYNSNKYIVGGILWHHRKKAQRKRAMRVADAVNKIVPVRSCAIELSNAWSEGKITGAQMKEALLKSHMEMARRVK